MLTIELTFSAAPRDERQLLGGSAAWRARHQDAIAWSFVGHAEDRAVVVAHLRAGCVGDLPAGVRWREIAPLDPAPMLLATVTGGLPFVTGTIAYPFCLHPDDDATRAPMTGRLPSGRWSTGVHDTRGLAGWRIADCDEPAVLWEHRAHGASWDLARAERLIALMTR